MREVESKNQKIRLALEKVRDEVFNLIKRKKYGSAISLLTKCTREFLMPRQDYDFYDITPYTNHVSEKYNLNDYVNASIISHNQEYIAAQCPKEKYFSVFRKLIKNSKCKLIVSLIEDDSDAYYSKRKILYENDILRDEELDGDVRRLKFKKWNDFAAPNNGDMVMFYEYYQKLKTDIEGIILVHCKAGVGRTGTFIMYDILKNANLVNSKVFTEVLLVLRSYRTCLVYCDEQLEFLAKVFNIDC